MAISEKTLQFLFENRLQDSREWFAAHKTEYQAYVQKPLKELVAQLAPTMEAIDPQLITIPFRVISRINRDTRFSKDKSLYREYMWCSFGRDKKQYPGGAEFFFSFGPQGVQYGCGYYGASTKTMEALRTCVLEKTPAFLTANDAVEAQSVFRMEGEFYKRSRYLEQPEALKQWLERKSIYFVCENTDAPFLYSENLHRKLAEDFMLLKDVYLFLQQCYRS